MNRLVAREPNGRGANIFRDDDRQELSAAPGLAIDTVALVVLRRALHSKEIAGEQTRELLRTRVGELTLGDVSKWLLGILGRER